MVNVSSGAQRFGVIRWDDPNFTTNYDRLAAYAVQGRRPAVRSRAGPAVGNGRHPRLCRPSGVVVGTKLNGVAGDEALRRMGLIDEISRPIIDPAVGKKTPAQGASTIVFAATSLLLAKIGGVHLKDNDISLLDAAPRQRRADCIPAEVASHSIDPDSAERLCG